MNLAELRATAPDGGAWSCSRPAGGWPAPDVLRQFVAKVERTYVRNASARMERVILVSGGSPSAGRSAKGYDDETWNALLEASYYETFNKHAATLGLRLEYESPPGRSVDPRRAATGIFTKAYDKVEALRKRHDLWRHPRTPTLKKAEQDAPSYHDAEPGGDVCGTCLYARGAFCALYHFFYDRGWTCDSHEATEGSPTPRVAPHDSKPNMGPPPSPNRPRFPYIGTLNFQGLLLYIENAPGSTRSGKDQNGDSWSVTMRCYYGEIPGTQGADGDPVDVYVGANRSAPMAYVIHQEIYVGTEDGIPQTYDEDKVMLGFDSKAAALAEHAAHFDHPVLEPGVTEIKVSMIKDMFAAGELEFTAIVKNCQALSKAGPFIGPRGGKWADAKHTIAWKEDKPKRKRKLPPKKKKKGPGSQLGKVTYQKLRDLGINRLPPADIPKSGIKVNLRARDIDKRAVISWRDSKNRWQHGYTPAFHEANANAKWGRVKAHLKDVPKIVKDYSKRLGEVDHGTLEHQAMTATLIMAHTGLRAGNEKNLAVHGVSTLTGSDVTVKGNAILFDFIGKGGKRNRAKIVSAPLAKAIKRYARNGKTKRLFDQRVLQHVRKSLPAGMKPKDFRTIKAANTAMRALRMVTQPPKRSGDQAMDAKAEKLAILKASKIVAEYLNNTPAVARGSYIPPEIIAQWALERD